VPQVPLQQLRPLAGGCRSSIASDRLTPRRNPGLGIPLIAFGAVL
jgi:hypothetical protein